MDGIDANGAADSTAFKTNLLSEGMYRFLQDAQEAIGFAEAFEEPVK